jgi:hypothetical protein
MQSMQTVPPWLRPGPLELDPEPEPVPVATPTPTPTRQYQPRPEVPSRERDARLEIEELRHEIEGLVRGRGDNPRDTLDSALESVTRLQVVTANIDACGPPLASFAAPMLVALADARLRGHADAIERGMTYTSDNQMQLLRGER